MTTVSVEQEEEESGVFKSAYIQSDEVMPFGSRQELSFVHRWWSQRWW